ncbi:MAG: hypothetical protein IPJ74_08495 [Saprospiraceae bacterium]|nr:hypothetical protein [Saprospiraceae bacterium]
MKSFIVIFILFLGISCSINKFIDTNESMKKWEKFVLKEVNKELKNIIKKCPGFNIKDTRDFYENEITLFPIKTSFEEIRRISKELKMKTQLDTIALVLSYPFVGFDPSKGYSSDLVILRNWEKSFVLRYSEKLKKFGKISTKIEPIDILKNFEKMESGCDYGYYIITYLTPSLEPIRCKSILGYALQPENNN